QGGVKNHVRISRIQELLRISRIQELWDPITGRSITLWDSDSLISPAYGLFDRFFPFSTILGDVSSPDGETILGADGGLVQLRKAVPVEGTAEQLPLWVQVLPRLELDGNDQVRQLDETTWQERRQRLEELLQSSPASDFVAAAAKDHLYWLQREGPRR